MRKRKIAGLFALSMACCMLVSGCSPVQIDGKIDAPQAATPTPGASEGATQEGQKTEQPVTKPDAEEGETEKEQALFPLEKGKAVPASCVSKDQTETVSDLTRDYADTLRDFAVESSNRIFPEVEGNYLYSPVSLFLALDLCAGITAEDAAPDLMKVLDVEDREGARLQGNILIRDLSSDQEGAILRIADSMWFDTVNLPEIGPNGYQVISDTAEIIGADVYHEKLTDPATQDKINGWISDRTDGMITELPLEPDGDTAAILLNTLLFDKHWKREITDRNIVKAWFYPEGDSEGGLVERIEYSEKDHPYVETAHAISSAAEYEDGSYIIFIKPNSDQDFEAAMTEDLQEVIRAYATKEYTENGGSYEVFFGIPMVDYSTGMKTLSDTISDMGVGSIFSMGTFRDIDKTLYVSKIAQDCRIIIDREGTKAAAVTEIEMKNGAVLMPKEEIDMRLDHEYGFVIMSDNDIPLFIGAVRDAGTE